MKKVKLIIFLSLIFLVGCSSIKIEKERFITFMDKKYDHLMEISDTELKNVYDIDITEFKEYVFKISYNEPTKIYVFVLPNNSSRNAKKEINKFFDKLSLSASDEAKNLIKDKFNDNIGDYLIYLVGEKSEETFNEIVTEFKKSE